MKKCVDKKEDYEINKKVRDIITDSFYKEKDYIKTIDLIKKFLNKIKSDKITCVYDFWFVYTMFGKVYLKQESYTQAIDNIETSFKYKVEDNFYYIAIWLLAGAYEQIGNREYAILNYSECVEYYSSIECDEYVLYCKFNIAKLEDDSDVIESLIRDYKEMKIGNNKSYDKDETLAEMYETLYDIYNRNNNNSKLINLIHTIENKQLRQKLLKSQKVLVAI